MLMSMRERLLRLEGDTGGNTGGGGGGAPAPTITVEVDGKAVTVPAPKGWISEKEIGEKFVPKAAHNDLMARERKAADERKSWRNPDELLEDDEFRARAVEKWGIDPKKTSADFQAQLAKTRTELQEREIKPREAKIGELSNTVQTLRQKDLEGQIARAAAAHKIDDKLLASPVKGKTPMIVSMLKDAFDFDKEHGEWFAKGANSQFAFSQNGGALPYQTVDEFIGVWTAGDGKAFVRSERQGGADANTGSGEGASGQVGKELRLTAEQIRDISFYKKMLEKAQKEGLTIVPV